MNKIDLFYCAVGVYVCSPGLLSLGRGQWTRHDSVSVNGDVLSSETRITHLRGESPYKVSHSWTTST